MRPVVQHHAADQLHIIVAQADGALGCLAHRGKGFGQDLIQLRLFGLEQLLFDAIDLDAGKFLLVGARARPDILLRPPAASTRKSSVAA